MERHGLRKPGEGDESLDDSEVESDPTDTPRAE